MCSNFKYFQYFLVLSNKNNQLTQIQALHIITSYSYCYEWSYCS